MITKHCEKIKIYDHYTNYKGRLFVKILCDLFNDMAEGQTKQLGFDVDTLNKQGQTWMLHRLHIHISKMPQSREEVIIETWPSGIERLFALRDYQMLRENGEILLQATSEWMLIDLNKRRPLRPTPTIIEMSTSHNIPKITIPSILDEKEIGEDIHEGRNFTATFDNIDFNGHVTQASYMRWITNALSFEFLKNHILVEVEVLYKHEIMPDSDIFSYYQIKQEGETTEMVHLITDKEKKIEHCVAKTIWQEHRDKKHI
ncbi:MAG: acyl-ACP thioesterase [Odoribacter sp.]|nr:acyl-ACP thioesterase [Odoribacter sp.]